MHLQRASKFLPHGSLYNDGIFAIVDWIFNPLTSLVDGGKGVVTSGNDRNALSDGHFLGGGLVAKVA